LLSALLLAVQLLVQVLLSLLTWQRQLSCSGGLW
jgi:hypothetical protein